jgi:tRNA modification GTPase
MEKSVAEHQDTAALSGDRTPGGAFVSRLTARGRGAIAVIVVWGPRAIEVTDSVFRPRQGLRLIDTPRGLLRLGHIGHGLGDEVVVVVRDEVPPAVEVQCHGGDAAVSLVIETLQTAGARCSDRAQPAAHFADDPFAEDALADLARSQTVATAEILLDQLHGALCGGLVRLKGWIAERPERALAELDVLIRRSEVGLRLVHGWRVAIAGRPNVGKSSIFNALVGFARAIVDPTPGTTRDVVSFTASFAGWPVELADTAGLRDASDHVENLGIERSRHEQQTADLVMLVLDRSQPLDPIDHELIATSPAPIVVGNKSDLPPAWHEGDHFAGSRAIVTVSAARGDGLDHLIEAIVGRLVPEPPPNGAAVPFRADQLDVLRQIKASVLAGDPRAALDQLRLMLEGRSHER